MDAARDDTQYKMEKTIVGELERENNNLQKRLDVFTESQQLRDEHASLVAALADYEQELNLEKAEEMSERQKEQICDAFEKFDADGSGHIDIDEFMAMAAELGSPMSKEEAKKAIGGFSGVDSPDKDTITFDEFKSFWTTRDVPEESNLAMLKTSMQANKLGSLVRQNSMVAVVAPADVEGVEKPKVAFSFALGEYEEPGTTVDISTDAFDAGEMADLCKLVGREGCSICVTAAFLCTDEDKAKAELVPNIEKLMKEVQRSMKQDGADEMATYFDNAHPMVSAPSIQVVDGLLKITHGLNIPNPMEQVIGMLKEDGKLSEEAIAQLGGGAWDKGSFHLELEKPLFDFFDGDQNLLEAAKGKVKFSQEFGSFLKTQIANTQMFETLQYGGDEAAANKMKQAAIAVMGLFGDFDFQAKANGLGELIGALKDSNTGYGDNMWEDLDRQMKQILSTPGKEFTAKMLSVLPEIYSEQNRDHIREEGLEPMQRCMLDVYGSILECIDGPAELNVDVELGWYKAHIAAGFTGIKIPSFIPTKAEVAEGFKMG